MIRFFWFTLDLTGSICWLSSYKFDGISTEMKAFFVQKATADSSIQNITDHAVNYLWIGFLKFSKRIESCDFEFMMKLSILTLLKIFIIFRRIVFRTAGFPMLFVACTTNLVLSCNWVCCSDISNYFSVVSLAANF